MSQFGSYANKTTSFDLGEPHLLGLKELTALQLVIPKLILSGILNMAFFDNSIVNKRRRVKTIITQFQ